MNPNPRSTRLQLMLAGLALLQLVHGLDSLRTDPAETFPGVILSPQSVLGIGGAIAAVVLLRRGHRRATRVATVVATLVGLGFVVVHGLPFASERTEPYWGDGSADAGQWIGVLAIVAVAGAILGDAQRVGRSNRSRSMTFAQAATKSPTNLSAPSDEP